MSFSSEVKNEVSNKTFTSKKQHSKMDKVTLDRHEGDRETIVESFLKSGSISDPNRFYHLEFVCESQQEAERLKSAIEDYNINPGIMLRKDRYVVYLKDSESIADMLVILGATNAVLEFENIRILKSMKEQVQRTVNCETHNISKTVTAAVRQLADINLIIENGAYDELPEGLKKLANLRLSYPEASLKELSSMLECTGKSGINHRFRRLAAIADSIRADIQAQNTGGQGQMEE